MKTGQVIITNGPLILPLVNGEYPGHVFKVAAGETIELTTKVTLHTRAKVDYLQFITNGKSVAEIRLDQWAKENGELPKIEFAESGWMVIRAVCRSDQEYRYASTAPYYVQVDDEPRISRKAAQFFLDWTVELAKRIKKNPGSHPDVDLASLRNARDFWNSKVAAANAD